MGKVQVRASLIALVAFGYYVALCAKRFTWVFVSGDSGDWLAASTWWMVPQPMGSPLYILLGQFLNLFPGSLVLKMTIVLSCLPSAITVALVYLIVREMTRLEWVAMTSSVVLLGSGILLSQSTVLEQYALPVMFLTLAYYLYIRGRVIPVGVCLGLATGVHIVVAPIALLWLYVERDRWRRFIPAGIAFTAFGLLPYTLILVLMAQERPPFLAGYLNYESVHHYWTGTSGAVIGNVSIFDVPRRFVVASGMILTSLGLAVVPLAVSVRRPFTKPIMLMLVTLAFVIWFHFTSLDPISWTFLSFGMPSLVILAGLGLAKLGRRHLAPILLVALALICANAVWMNAEVLTKDNPQAEDYKAWLEGLPDGSGVIVYAGHYSLGLFYTVAQGKDLIPLLFLAVETDGFGDYGTWLRETYGIVGRDTQAIAMNTWLDGRPVYIAGGERKFDRSVRRVAEGEAFSDSEDWEYFLSCLEIEGAGYAREVTGFTQLWQPQ